MDVSLHIVAVIHLVALKMAVLWRSVVSMVNTSSLMCASSTEMTNDIYMKGLISLLVMRLQNGIMSARSLLRASEAATARDFVGHLLSPCEHKHSRDGIYENKLAGLND